MKHLLLITFLFSLFSFQTKAQTDLISFVNSLNWNSTESELLERYPGQIQKRKHFGNKEDNTVIDWEIDSLSLGGYYFNVSFVIDSTSRKLNSLSCSLPKGSTDKIDSETLSKELTTLLTKEYGSPDVVKDNKGDFMSTYEKKWYKDSLMIEVNHMVFPKLSDFYGIEYKPIEKSKPDFRVANWGDSKKQVMDKEGKEDLAKTDRIYLFNDYIAGMSCQVAYIFNNDKLTMTKYVIKSEHTNQNIQIRTYKSERFHRRL